MSATPETAPLTTADAPIVDRMTPAQRLARRGRGRSAIDRRPPPRRLLTVLVLAVCVITALLAVPDLRPVAGEIADMNPAVVAAALGLELASCLSFVVIFRLFFNRVPTTIAREMAWSQMGSGALLPGGGVGSLAVGGWLLHLVGMSAQQIVRRSSGLFFLTSAINVFALAAAGLLLLFGITDGPHDMLRAGLPVIAALAATILVLGLPNLTRRVSSKHAKAAWLEDIGIGIPAARHALTRPSGAWAPSATCYSTSRCSGRRSPPSVPSRHSHRSSSLTWRATSPTLSRSPEASASSTPASSALSRSTDCP